MPYPALRSYAGLADPADSPDDGLYVPTAITVRGTATTSARPAVGHAAFRHYNDGQWSLAGTPFDVRKPEAVYPPWSFSGIPKTVTISGQVYQTWQTTVIGPMANWVGSYLEARLRLWYHNSGLQLDTGWIRDNIIAEGLTKIQGRFVLNSTGGTVDIPVIGSTIVDLRLEFRNPEDPLKQSVEIIDYNFNTGAPPPPPTTDWAGRRAIGWRPQVRVAPEFNNVIVLHTSEPPKTSISTTQALANYFNGANRGVSYHYFCDRTEWVNWLNPASDRAYHARAIGNNNIGFAFTCKAAAWGTMSSADKQALLTTAATGLRAVQTRFDIPRVLLSLDDYVAGSSGFVYHSTIDPGRKFDPGEDFPWNDLRSLLLDP